MNLTIFSQNNLPEIHTRKKIWLISKEIYLFLIHDSSSDFLDMQKIHNYISEKIENKQIKKIYHKLGILHPKVLKILIENIKQGNKVLDFYEDFFQSKIEFIAFFPELERIDKMMRKINILSEDEKEYLVGLLNIFNEISDNIFEITGQNHINGCIAKSLKEIQNIL